jgi:hypothetical protein
MPEPTLNRRIFTVALAAAGASLGVAFFLPSKWAKPLVKVGVLPAHAQTSQTPTIHAAADVELTGCWLEDFVSSATISPVRAGVTLHYEVAVTGASTTPPVMSSESLVTDATGTASVNFNDYAISTHGTTVITITWSFANPADGSGSDAQVFTLTMGFC